MELGNPPPAWIDYNSEVWYESREKVAGNRPFLLIRKSGDDSYWMQYAEGTNVWICEGASRIWVTWADRSCVEEAATFLLAAVMAFAAQLRGMPCLHGCAVTVDGAITAILGPPGAGKSSTAATFAKLGYAIASDDLVLVTENAGSFAVEPSFPVLRLWPSTVESLFGDPEAVPLLSPMWDKRGLNLNQPGYAFQDSALPLASIYVLGPRSPEETAPYIEPLTGAEAIKALVSNSWARYVNRPEMLAPQLETWTRISRSLPIRRVTPHADFDRLPALCRFLVDDFRKTALCY